MTRTLRAAGIGLVVLYAAVAALTSELAPPRFRPLFDGFAPPAPYNWVQPPPELARDNRRPEPAERDIPLGASGSEVTSVTTGDSQAVAGLEAGSVAPNPADTSVRVRLVPVDPGTLAPLPPEVKAVSNAYQVTLTYQPSGTPVTQLAKPGTVALSASSVGDRLLYSADGSSWQEKPSRPYGTTNGRFAALDVPGYYLVAAHSAAASSQTPSTQTGTPRRPNSLLLWVVGALPIVGAVLVLRPAPAPPRTPTSTAKRPAVQPSGKKRKRKRKRP